MPSGWKRFAFYAIAMLAGLAAPTQSVIAQEQNGKSEKPEGDKPTPELVDGVEGAKLALELLSGATKDKLAALNYPTSGGTTAYLEYSTQRLNLLSAEKLNGALTKSLSVTGAAVSTYSAYTSCTSQGVTECGLATAKADASLLVLGGPTFRVAGTSLDFAATSAEAGYKCYNGDRLDCLQGSLDIAGSAIGFAGPEGELVSGAYKVGYFTGRGIDSEITAALGEPLGDWAYEKLHPAITVPARMDDTANVEAQSEINGLVATAISNAEQHSSVGGPSDSSNDLLLLSRDASEAAASAQRQADEVARRQFNNGAGTEAETDAYASSILQRAKEEMQRDGISTPTLPSETADQASRSTNLSPRIAPAPAKPSPVKPIPPCGPHNCYN